MKWYKRYPAEFVVKTRHLTLVESGAYNALLDHYYTQEEPLPNDVAELCRIANAHTPTEKRAVERVASEFFRANGAGELHNKRADEEITKARHISEKRSKAGSKGGSSAKH